MRVCVGAASFAVMAARSSSSRSSSRVVSAPHTAAHDVAPANNARGRRHQGQGGAQHRPTSAGNPCLSPCVWRRFPLPLPPLLAPPLANRIASRRRGDGMGGRQAADVRTNTIQLPVGRPRRRRNGRRACGWGGIGRTMGVGRRGDAIWQRRGPLRRPLKCSR